MGCVGSVVQSSGVCNVQCRKGLHSCWGGGAEEGTTARFRKTECWDALLERTWGMAVSCEKAGRKMGPEGRREGGMMLERAFMKGRQPQRGTMSLKLTPR